MIVSVIAISLSLSIVYGDETNILNRNNINYVPYIDVLDETLNTDQKNSDDILLKNFQYSTYCNYRNNMYVRVL